MKVLLLSWEYPPVMVGGLGRHVHALSTTLAAHGHQVTVVTRHSPGAPTVEHRDGVRVVRAPEDPPLLPLSTSTLLAWTMSFNHSVTRAALQVARTTEFDVIHAHDWLVTQAAVTLREQLGVPLVTTIHATEAGRHQGWLPEELNRSIHSVEWWLANESSRVVVCSHYMRWEVNRLLQVPYGRIDVVPNGVDVHAWKPDHDKVAVVRQRYAIGDAPLIGFAGRLVYEKGVQDIINALPILRSRHPGLRLVVAGDGPYRQHLQDHVNSLNMRQAVSFTGFLNDELIPVLAAMDAMIVPSIYEPFGMVAIEAAAVGAPVVAAATGGLKEIVEPGRTGMTFRPGDSQALADAVSRLLGNPEDTRRMARTAHNMVADRYSWDTITRRISRSYAAATAGRRAAAGEPAPAAAARPSMPGQWSSNGTGHPHRVAPATLDGNLLGDTRTPARLAAGHVIPRPRRSPGAGPYRNS